MRPNPGMEPTRYARAHATRLACLSFWLTWRALPGPRAAHAAAVVRAQVPKSGLPAIINSLKGN